MILVGPSGCGKSTALRMIAGLEDISEGELKIGGEVVNDLAPKDRDIAMVFQNYALYPHMTVRENMGFALKLRKASPRRRSTAASTRRPRSSTSSQHLDRKPANLSGGQRQRVAMGRAIVREPKAFLMDEPLSNLDAKLRVQMRAEVSRLQQRLGHDHRLRDPRPDRGHDPRRPRRGHARRHPAAGRRAEGALRQPDEPLRRRLHRLAGDELLRRPRWRATRSSTPMGDVPLDDELRRSLEQPRVGRTHGHRRHPPGGLRGRALRARGPRGLDLRGRRSSSPSRWAPRSTRTSTSRAATRSRPRSCASSRRTPGTSDVPGSASGHAVARVDANSGVKAGERSKLWLDATKLHLFDPVRRRLADAGARHLRRPDARSGVAGRGQGRAAGSVSVARAPPAGSLAASMSPPCARASRRAIARPSPAPPVAGARARSERKRGSNTWSRSSGAKPGPVVDDLDAHGAVLALRAEDDPAAAVADRVVQQVGQHAQQRVGVAVHGQPGSRPRTCSTHPRAAAIGSASSAARRASARDVDLLEGDRVARVLQPAEGEQVADEPVEVRGLGLGAVEVARVADAALERLERAAQREQRRAQVVGDGGDHEAALALGGGRGAAARRPTRAAMPCSASPTCATSRARVAQRLDVELAAGDALGVGGQPRQRLQHPAPQEHDDDDERGAERGAGRRRA